MKLLGGLAIAFSMYSKIPVPQVEWTKERMKYAMCFFPLVGVAQGILLYVFAWGTGRLELRWFYAAGGAVLPLVVSGGIHMDGFLDVVDARASFGDREKKLAILKDPHTGAFAIIGCAVYMVLYLGLFGELPMEYVPVMGCVYVLIRGMSGLSVVWFPKAKNSGLAAAFSEGAAKRTVAVVMACYIAASLGGVLWTGGWLAAGLCALGSVLVYGYYYRISTREFGGITGDLAGYFLQICELLLLAVLVAASRL